MDLRQLLHIIQQYNDDPRKFSDKEAEVIATLARELDSYFKRESKPIGKGLHSLGEQVTLGYLPDDWRPVSRGESVFGETGLDKFGSGVGSLLGFAVGGYGLAKGAGALGRGSKSAISNLRSRFGRRGGGGSPSAPAQSLLRARNI
jgi:hypothetical protein